MVKVNIHMLASENVKDPILIIPDDEEHPFTKVVYNDALKITVDYSKMPDKDNADDVDVD